MYIKITNGTIEKFPYTIGDLRKAYPNTSFPKVLPLDRLAEHGIYPVENTQPVYDDSVEELVNNGPVLVDGSWKIDYSVVPLSQEELDLKELQERKLELSGLENTNRVVLRLLLSLIDKLVAADVVAPSDFTAQERQMYQRAKELKDLIF